jgi:PAS domain S-box-containing protein
MAADGADEFLGDLGSRPRLPVRPRHWVPGMGDWAAESPAPTQGAAAPASQIRWLRSGDIAELAWRVIDGAPDGILMFDEAGRLALVNRHAEEMFGYPEGELIGRSVEDLVPERLACRHRDRRASSWARPNGRSRGRGVRMLGRRRDDSEFPLEVRLAPARIEQGTWVVATLREGSLDEEAVGRELSDKVVQRLFAAGLVLDGTVARVTDEAVVARLHEVVRELDATIQVVRRAALSLGADPEA